jgi:hypothetical protein
MKEGRKEGRMKCSSTMSVSQIADAENKRGVREERVSSFERFFRRCLVEARRTDGGRT